MECSETHEGHACTRKGEHTLHRAQVGFEFVTWGEPEPVSHYIKPRKKKEKKADIEARLLQNIHTATGVASSV